MSLLRTRARGAGAGAGNAFYVLDNGHAAPVDCHSLGERFKDIMQSAPRSVRRGWLQQRRRVRHLLKQHWPDPSGLDAYRNFDR